ncbi:MAG TPA: hypothetical protein VFG33_02110 [Kribbella sp.]|uniref:hypothetical protein n=1 Tax=Kribbella sp. TaxID=1871183 RepID=UPI002D789B2C|nr:hypothetical protein [Kribbella sp.]HET6292130.1 hypothetical protein [Kribbella sp.]
MPASTTADPEQIVTAILTAAQLTVSEQEFATFVRDYPLIRQAADALYLPELDPDEPAIKFDPLDFYSGAVTAPAGKDA